MNAKLFLSCFFLLLGKFSFAQKPIYTKAKVSAVKVYKNSAELENIATFHIPAGTSEVIIGNISDEIETQSLRFGFSNKNISILSSQFTEDYTSNFKIDTSNPQIKKVNDSIKIVENLITNNKIETDANKKAIELLDKNQTILVGSSTSSVAQLTQLTEFYTKKRIEIDHKLITLSQQEERLKKQLSHLKNSLKTTEEKESEEFASGALVLKLMSSTNQQVNMNINYLSQNANWRPYYEIKGENISQPLNITLKAIVRQNTGLDWKSVKLSLIDGYPSRNQNAPSVEPWFLSPTQPQHRSKLMGANNDKVSSLKLEEKEIEEVVVSGFQTNNNQLNTNYETDIPYDILSNDEDHLITLNQQKVPVEFLYFTAPNYRKEAFLTAKVKDFNKFDIVSANANIIFENMYVGETEIQANQTKEELSITLGNDPKISIKRENINDKSSEKLLSSYQEKTITYDLIIRNNKKESIQIEIKDRFPISNDSAIKVELLEHSNAEKDLEKGILTWKMKINPSETKKLRVSYKVRYPKDYILHL